MIFVTVGTHEQQFDRLVRAVDNLKQNRIIDEPVFIQTGYSKYEPTSCDYSKFVSFGEMKQLVSNADVIITHGGPSSFIEAIIAGKMPIVVPRRGEYGEHVNNHQVDFIRIVAKRQGGIIPVYDITELATAITHARTLSCGADFVSHNADFCNELCRLIERM